MKKARRCPISSILFSLLLVGTPLLGQTPLDQTPNIVSEIDTTLISVGDHVTLLISVNHAPGSRVVWPDSLNLEPFEVLEGRPVPPVSRGETVRSSLALTLTAFELGDLEIPSFPVQLLSEGGEGTVLHTNPFGVQVTSVGLDEGSDIRGIKGPLGVPVSLGRVLLMALTVLGALVVAYLFFRRWKRGDDKGAEMEKPRALPLPPPHEVALEAFRRLEASPLLSQGRIKDYHIQASEILRVYVEGRFGVAALEMTTSDITGGLEASGVEPGLIGKNRDFLHRCDMVKFAKSRPADADSLSTLRLGREIVEDSIPTATPTGSQPQSTTASQAQGPTSARVLDTASAHVPDTTSAQVQGPTSAQAQDPTSPQAQRATAAQGREAGG